MYVMKIMTYIYHETFDDMNNINDFLLRTIFPA